MWRGFLQLTGHKHAPKKVLADIRDRITEYAAGKSLKQISDETGVGRFAIARMFRDAGVKIRDQSAAESIKWSGMTSDQRAAQVSAAHVARRGSTASIAELRNRAVGCFTACNSSSLENHLASMLRELNVSLTQQFPIGEYNVDIAANSRSVAVEVFGGGWHAYGRHFARHEKRCKDILNQGWRVLIVWVDSRRYPSGSNARRQLSPTLIA